MAGSRPNLKKISNKKAQPPTFAIDGSQIEIVEKAKYLGVQFDQHLIWDEHVRFVYALGFLKYDKKLLPQETLSHIYRGIAEPYFRYCSSVWGSCGETKLLTLQKLQNRLAPTYLSNIFSRHSTRDTVYLRNSKTDLQVPLFNIANG